MTSIDGEAPALLAAGRQLVIVDRLRESGTVRVRELASLLGVSDVTIRRDIDALAERGSIEKIHGGAQLHGTPSRDEQPFAAKRLLQSEAKRAIAVEAATLVRPGMVIGVSAGTTTFLLPHELRRIANLTIITNSMPVARQFEPTRSEPWAPSTVLLTGGESTPSSALVGPIAVATVSRLHVDLLLLGVHGVEENAGFTTPNLLESEFNRAFIAAASRVAVIADSTKWGTVGMSSMGSLDVADTFITDAGLPEGARTILRRRIAQVVVVSDPHPLRDRGTAP